MQATFAVYVHETDRVFPFAIDRAGSAPEVPSEEGQISAAEFLEKLYVPRPQIEEALRTQLILRNELLVLTGPRGCGKTSTAYSVLSRLTQEGWRFIVVDLFGEPHFKKCREALHNHAPSRLGSWITETVVNQLFAHLFPPGQEWELWRFMLSEARYPFANQLTSAGVLREIKEDAKRIFGRLYTASTTQYDEWLYSEEATQHAGLARLIRARLKVELRAEHIVYAACCLGRAGRVVVVMDNVERLPNPCQRECFEAAYNLEHQLGPLGRVLVSLRDETVKHPLAGGVPAADAVCLPLANREHVVPSLRVPDLSSAEVQALLKARFAWIRARLREQNVPDGQLEVLAGLENQILSRYVADRVIELANQNVRDVLGAHTRFLEFLQERFSAAGDVFGGDGYRMESLFYSWLVRRGEQSGLATYDVILPIRNWRRDPKKHHGCMLEYVLLACAYRHQRQLALQTGTDYPFVIVKTLVADIVALGYPEEDVRRAILGLYVNGQNHGVLVDFRDIEGAIDEDQKMDDCAMLYVTPAGSVLFNSIVHRMVYLVEYYLKQHMADQSAMSIQPARMLSISLEWLCHMADMHRAGLLKIRDSSFGRQSKSWYSDYMAKYTFEGALQLEKTITSHRAHCENLPGAAENPEYARFAQKLSDLLYQYRRSVADISTGRAPDGREFAVQVNAQEVLV